VIHELLNASSDPAQESTTRSSPLISASMRHLFALRGSAIALPDVLQCFRKRLEADSVVNVAGVFSKDKLIVIVLCGQHARHALVGHHPVVHAIVHGIGVEEVVVAYLHPDADGFARTLGDEMLVKLPCAVRCGGVVGPLLVDEGS